MNVNVITQKLIRAEMISSTAWMPSENDWIKFSILLVNHV